MLAIKILVSIRKFLKKIISHLASGHCYHWLSKEYPDRYKILLSKLGSRNQGDKSHNSKYSNTQIIDVFNRILENSSSLKQISKDTDISYSVVSGIAMCDAHIWLKEFLPEKYATLEKLKGTRQSLASSAISKGIVYPKILSPEGKEFSITNAKAFALEYKLDPSCLVKVLNRHRKSHKGWKLA